MGEREREIERDRERTFRKVSKFEASLVANLLKQTCDRAFTKKDRGGGSVY